MGFHRKLFRWRAVRNDDGFEVEFVSGDKRAQLVSTRKDTNR